MTYPTLEEAIALHEMIIEAMGGASGYSPKSLGYLASALEQIQNDTYYPHFIDKLTHLIFSCVKFHPFLDGNKRTSLYIGVYFMELNGYQDRYEAFITALEDEVVRLASGELSKEDFRHLLSDLLSA